jgi:hypothetical protein
MAFGFGVGSMGTRHSWWRTKGGQNDTHRCGNDEPLKY